MRNFKTILCTVAVICGGLSFSTSTFGSEAHQINPAAVPNRNTELWWLKRHESKIEAVKKEQFNLIFIGDSITQDWEKNAPPPWGNFQQLWDRFYGDRHALNLGFGGDTTSNVLWRLENGELENQSPKLVVLLIGGNNSEIKHWSSQQTIGGISAIIDLLHDKLPETKILLLGILPSDRSQQVSMTNSLVNRGLSRKYGRSTFVTYRDIGRVFETGPFFRKKINNTLYYEPHKTPPKRALHPTSVGQEKLSEAIEPTIKKLLK